MPGQRLPMRQVREVLRLATCAATAATTDRRGRGREPLHGGRVSAPRRRGRHHLAGAAELDDAALERRLFTPPFVTEPHRPQPAWARIHAELRRPGVTLMLLWEEYRAGQPEGYGYSRFCALYAEWRGRLSPTMRQTHPAGERLFVDYAGQTAEVIDAATGEVRAAQIFVAVLGRPTSPTRRRAGRRRCRTGSAATWAPSPTCVSIGVEKGPRIGVQMGPRRERLVPVVHRGDPCAAECPTRG